MTALAEKDNLLAWYPFTPNGKRFVFSAEEVTSICACQSEAAQYDEAIVIGANRALYRAVFGGEVKKMPKTPYEEFAELLAFVNTKLKSDGTLLLALHNRLGLQYFAGQTDESSRAIFAGIEGDWDAQEEYAVSKKRLVTMLKDAGFFRHTFYYPVPDYTFPTMLFSDEYLPRVGEVRPTSTHFSKRYQVFNEKKAFDAICEDGLFGEFANAFLVVAKR